MPEYIVTTCPLGKAILPNKSPCVIDLNKLINLIKERNSKHLANFPASQLKSVLVTDWHQIQLF